MKIADLLLLVCLASAADDFATQAKAQRAILREKSLPAERLAGFHALVAAAATDEQRIEARTLLVEALGKVPDLDGLAAAAQELAAVLRPGLKLGDAIKRLRSAATTLQRAQRGPAAVAVLRALLPSVAGDAATMAQVRLDLARLVDAVEAESLYVAVAEDAASPPVERSRAWYEGGRLAQARGDTAAAKTRFAAALATEGGDERSRVAARDALAGIRYFE